MRKLSYLLYSTPIVGQMAFTGGLFQWTRAFAQFGKDGQMSGMIKKHEMEKFDVVHTNWTPAHPGYPEAIRRELGENSSTKLIVNVDYAINHWNHISPLVLAHQLRQADFVFSVESFGADRIARLMLDENINEGTYVRGYVPVIPHPIDVETVKTVRKPTEEREMLITCQYHRYHNNWCEYWYPLQFTMKTARADGNERINTALMNVEGEGVKYHDMFNVARGRSDYPSYMEALSHAMVNMDITPDYTYGRGIVDAAALGVPTIASNTIEAARRIWPELIVQYGDDAAVEHMIISLLGDNDRYDAMQLRGIEKCEDYNLENSYNKMVEYLELTEVV